MFKKIWSATERKDTKGGCLRDGEILVEDFLSSPYLGAEVMLVRMFSGLYMVFVPIVLLHVL